MISFREGIGDMMLVFALDFIGLEFSDLLPLMRGSGRTVVEDELERSSAKGLLWTVNLPRALGVVSALG